MRDAAIAYLERLLASPEGDPEEPRSQLFNAEGALIAYERLGLISAREAARWRARFVERGQPSEDKARFDDDLRAEAERYLTDLLERVPPARREPDPAEIATAAECSTAIDALHAVGVLDAAAEARWRARLLGAQAPWLDQPTPPTGHSFSAFWVPPETEQQAAEDAAQAAAWAARPEARQVRRVVIGSPLRQDDLAVVALVVHEDATSLYFHYLGGSQVSGAHGFDSLDAFSEEVDSLTPPALRDESRLSYEPVDQRPTSASGAGGLPDPSRRQAISGTWRYTPAAPEDVRAFRVERGERRWDLRDPS